MPKFGVGGIPKAKEMEFLKYVSVFGENTPLIFPYSHAVLRCHRSLPRYYDTHTHVRGN